MSLLQKVNKSIVKNTVNKVKEGLVVCVGDIISIEYFSVMSGLQLRKFVGICIRTTNNVNINNNYITLRNVFNGVAMEFSFYNNWNQIVSLNKLGIKFKKLRKSKLYYLRKQILSNSTVK